MGCFEPRDTGVLPGLTLLLPARTTVSIPDNLRLASERLKVCGKTLVIRMVIAPGINDGANVADLADLPSSLPFVSAVELLPYHHYGAHKYDLLGRRYAMTDLGEPSPELMGKLKEVLRSGGLPVVQDASTTEVGESGPRQTGTSKNLVSTRRHNI